MKRLLLFTFIFSIFCCMNIQQAIEAAPLRNIPTYVIQPNGDTLHCFVSGDEFYQRLHDKNNYTIVQHPTTGYYMYAMEQKGQLVPSKYIAGTVDPQTIGIEPNLTISIPEIIQCHKKFDIPESYRAKATPHQTNHGVLNNIVIYIRFADDSAFTTQQSKVEQMYNDSSANAISVFNYYQAASYKKIRILTHFYPTPNGNQIISYQDSHPRSYYCEYSVTNTNGYNGDNERRNREFSLLENATNYIDSLNIVSPTLNIDQNDDGIVDNISYIIKGGTGNWNSLLWPHKWSLWDRDVYINNKVIRTFNFILEGGGDYYFSVQTICHEMFHALGAPDLYHYSHYTNLSPTGMWDIMEQTLAPPQHMGAYMKFKYGKWIDSIPTLNQTGTYYLNSVGDPRNTHNCYKILTEDENQYYVLEFRDNTRPFEESLPGTGLLVYRIDTRFEGNAEYDRQYFFDEVYIFRPNGYDTIDGNINDAYFTQHANRTKFDYTTNPYPTLTNNNRDSSFTIRNIHIVGDSVIFDYIQNTIDVPPTLLYSENITTTTADISWKGFYSKYIVEYENIANHITDTIVIDSTHLHLTNLLEANSYRWRVMGIQDSNTYYTQDSSDMTDWIEFTTMPCDSIMNTSIGDGDANVFYLPFNTETGYSYTQQLYTKNELGTDSIEIQKIAFDYEPETPINNKSDFDIYLGLVDKQVFNSNTDLVPIDNLTLVYSGYLQYKQGWNHIRLDSVFVYDGTHDLVIAIDDNSGVSDHHANFKATYTNEYQALSYYSDTENPDPTNLSNFNGLKKLRSFHNNIRFVSCDNSNDNDGGGNDDGGDTTDIETLNNDDVKIIIGNLQINISSELPHTYTLYNIMGNFINQSNHQTSYTIKVPQIGIYLLKIDNHVTKKLVVY